MRRLVPLSLLVLVACGTAGGAGGSVSSSPYVCSDPCVGALRVSRFTLCSAPPCSSYEGEPYLQCVCARADGSATSFVTPNPTDDGACLAAARQWSAFAATNRCVVPAAVPPRS